MLRGFTTHKPQHHAGSTLHVNCVYDRTIQGYNVSLELLYKICEWFWRVSMSILCTVVSELRISLKQPVNSNLACTGDTEHSSI